VVGNSRLSPVYVPALRAAQLLLRLALAIHPLEAAYPPCLWIEYASKYDIHQHDYWFATHRVRESVYTVRSYTETLLSC
jgi:hypothetical protein